MMTKTKMMLAAGLLSLGVGAAWMARSPTDAATDPAAAAGGPTHSWSRMGASAQAVGQDAQPATAGLTAEQVRHRLYKGGSFEGTTPLGDWCVTPEKALKPCPGLRDRFEYHLLGLGEVSIGDIRAWIDDEARRANGDKLAGEIMAVFDRYWQLRTTGGLKHELDANNLATWMPALQELQALRRQILGAEWAQAFFAEDDKELMATYQQLASGTPPPPSPRDPVPMMSAGKDPAAVRAERLERYGADTTARLESLDREQDEWRRNLASARQEWARLKGAGNLSDVQRQEQMEQFIQSHFDPKNHRRVKALLQIERIS